MIRIRAPSACAYLFSVETSELRTLAAYIRALGERMEIIADFGGERLVVG